MESKLGLQGPAVFLPEHGRQLQLVKDNTISASPSDCSPLPSHTQVLMLFSFSGSSLVGSHSPQKLSSVTYSPQGVCIGAGPPASLAFSPKPVLRTRGLLLQNDFRVCGPEGQGSASCCTLAGSEDLLTGSIIPRVTPDSEVWC